MLVYCNNFRFEDHKSEERAFALAAAYLSGILSADLSVETIKAHSKASYKGAGVNCEICYINTGKEQILSVLLQQQENDIGGRIWSTELAITEGEKETISILTKTEDLCIGRWNTPRKIRPKFIDFIEQNDEFREQSVGHELWNIENSQAAYQRLAEKVKDEQRAYPIICISSTKLKPPVDPQEVQRQAFGLAQTVYIGADYDFDCIKNIIGTPYFAVGGALNIIFPYDKGQKTYPYKLSLWHDLAGKSEADIMMGLLSQLTRRTNLIKKRQHLSFKDIWLRQTEQQIKESEQRFRQKLEQAKTKGEDAAALDEILAEYETREANFVASKTHMEDEIRSLTEKLDIAFQDIDNKDIELEELRKLQNGGAREKTDDNDEFYNEFISLLADKGKNLTPEKCLDLAQRIWPQSFVILDEAMKSAREAADSQYSHRLLESLAKLAKEFLPAFLEGGDNRARLVFGTDTYALKESEQTMNNPKCRRQRTFTYKEQEVPMWRHLRWGVANNTREGLRLYFGIDQEDGKIVIGHCGRHLDTIKSSSV